VTFFHAAPGADDTSGEVTKMGWIVSGDGTDQQPAVIHCLSASRLEKVAGAAYHARLAGDGEIPVFTGSMVALVTPMTNDGVIDEPALERLVERQLSEKTDAIVAVGTTGESATLSGEEKLRVIRRTVELVDRRIPVIAGTGTCSTAESVDLTLRACQAGASACLLITPYYNKPTQAGLYQHYRAIAEASDVPLLLYNVPSRTACDLLPETVARLAELEGVVGIKEAVPGTDRIRAHVSACGEEFAVISGDDLSALESMKNGARGVISVTANVAPGAMHRLCEAALAGDREAAEAENSRLKPLHAALFLESNPIPVKWALEAMGLIPGGLRLPLTRLDASHHEVLRRALAHADVPITG